MKYRPTPPVPPRAVPAEVVPTIDALKAQRHKTRAIARALSLHENTIRAVLRRTGAYKGIPK